MRVLAYLCVGLALFVGHMASGARRKRADELADAWYRRRAEARLRTLRDDEAAEAVREAERIMAVAR